MTDRWKRCPSTHCERWQECRSPNECIIHTRQKPFLHVVPDIDLCEHDFQGWREFDGGGEQVCTKCGIGAMAYTLRVGF